jgi:hypothetical protein
LRSSRGKGHHKLPFSSQRQKPRKLDDILGGKSYACSRRYLVFSRTPPAPVLPVPTPPLLALLEQRQPRRKLHLGPNEVREILDGKRILHTLPDTPLVLCAGGRPPADPFEEVSADRGVGSGSPGVDGLDVRLGRVDEGRELGEGGGEGLKRRESGRGVWLGSDEQVD